MEQDKTALKNFLCCFGIITSQGKRTLDKFELGALQAWSDFDGYTCYIGYKDLTLTLLFHGRYSFYYTNRSTYQKFLIKIQQILLQGDVKSE